MVALGIPTSTTKIQLHYFWSTEKKPFRFFFVNFRQLETVQKEISPQRDSFRVVRLLKKGLLFDRDKVYSPASTVYVGKGCMPPPLGQTPAGTTTSTSNTGIVVSGPGDHGHLSVPTGEHRRRTFGGYASTSFAGYFASWECKIFYLVGTAVIVILLIVLCRPGLSSSAAS